MKNKQKKKSNGKWLQFLILVAVGAVSGLPFFRYLEHSTNEGLTGMGLILSYILTFVCLYLALLVQIIVHEAGHLIFGLMTGYRFSSFRILNLMWIKKDGKIMFKRMATLVNGGQCLMSPPDLIDGQMPVMLYNFGGVIMNAVTALLCLGFSLLFSSYSIAWLFTVFLAIIGFAFALLNGIPFNLSTMNNDGRNALDLSKNPETMRALWIQLKVTELLSEGLRVKDMPDEWFVVPSDESMKNGLIATVGVLACEHLMDKHQFNEADMLINRLLTTENGVVGIQRNLLVCNRMYIELITNNRADVLEKMRTKQQLKFMKAMRGIPSIIRTEYAYALLAEKDGLKTETLLWQFDNCALTYPYPSEIQSNMELINIAYHVMQNRFDGGNV